MQKSSRLNLLAAGTSIFALGIAASALAAGPGIFHQIQAITPVATYTIDGILNTGVTSSGTVANSLVSSPVTSPNWGEISQIATAVGTTPGDANNIFTINGNLSINAIAAGINTLGAAGADAVVDQGLHQYAKSTAGAIVGLANNGTLTVNANANANAAGAGLADATATIDTGIWQHADGGSNAALTITNASTGVLNITANATALGMGADASASASSGIYQYAYASGVNGTASATITNAGALSVTANAHAVATAGSAHADATAYGIYQYANTSNGGNATVGLTNSGTLTVSALADAIATNLAHTGGDAFADAYIGTGISQSAHVLGGVGNAAVSLTNSGTLNITANGNAKADHDATAWASLSSAIYQSADSHGDGAASAALSNTGTINITATANAQAAVYASASASIDTGIYQTADTHGVGNASAALTNSGTLNIAATANAAAASASAFASISDGISQEAFASGSGNATVDLTNSGTLNITATAKAVASAGYADASASIDSAINQYAYTADGGNASVSLTNSGTMNIAALANATGTSAYADASVSYSVIAQDANAYGGGDATIALTNSGTLNIMATAKAVASAGKADAYASISSAISQDAYASGGGNASVALTNSGTFNIAALANATGTSAYARASVSESVIGQYANASGGGDAAVALTNSGTLNITAAAGAVANVGTADAVATVSSAITQAAYADNGGHATVGLTNSGKLNITASANALATNVAGTAGNAYAYASVSTGISQYASASGGGNAGVDLTNSSTGVLNITALANAKADGWASASAFVDTGIWQEARTYAGGTAAATLSNSGTINITSDAVANGYGASAQATVDTGISQNASAYATGEAAGGNASVALTNSSTGVINITATADAVAAHTSAYASASISSAIYQDAHAPDGLASSTLTNSGKINVIADAKAVSAAADASAYAYADAVLQYADGKDATATFTNSGTFKVAATAEATAESHASAQASAYGVWQDISGSNSILSTFKNSGTFTVDAFANAHGAVAGASATASASGYSAGGGSLNLDVTNSGIFEVSAKAVADGSAHAWAEGMHFSAFGYGTTVSSVPAGTITGNITNSGSLTVVANAVGDVESTATALGIHMVSGANSSILTNTGKITVSAVTTGGPASADAILINSNAPVAAAAIVPLAIGDPFTLVNNGGTIIARQSTDGGLTWKHGDAIDTSNAPNGSVINLKGAGYIYGDIIVASGDQINVLDGETKLDGVVNPGGGVGALTIAAGSTLFLTDHPNANPAYDGPSDVNVDTLTVAPGGKLAIELVTNSVPAIAQADYPVITALTSATITGSTLEIRPSSENGLYANAYTFNHVIDSPVIDSNFAHVITKSPLMTFTSAVNEDTHVDVSMSRNAFNAVPGLTINQHAVGGGIEHVYSPAMTGPFAGMVADLFTLDTPSYISALDQLKGSEYASYLQSLPGMAGRFNDLIYTMSCPVVRVDTSKPCRLETGGRFWSQVDYGHITKDGDIEASGYHADQWLVAVGFDYAIDPNAVLGISAGYINDKLNFDQYNAQVKSTGFQIGAYGVYDTGLWYAKGLLSYADLNGDARRSINIGPHSTGTIYGDPDATVFSINGDAGYRFETGGSVITPHVGFEFADAHLRSFTESGVAGADLSVDGHNQNRFASILGLRWEGLFGQVRPEVALGWRHQFGGDTASIGASFDAMPGSDFTIISQTEKRDLAIIDLGIYGKIANNVYGRLSYQGRLNGDYNSNAVGLSIIVHFGG